MDIQRRLLLISALGAHSNSGGEWFRQKEMKFLVELFTNWMDVMLKPDVPVWHNTQIMRFLDDLVKAGRAKVHGQGRQKKYRLTRVGLLELIYELVDIKGYSEFRHSLLVYYFIVAYRGRMTHLIGREASGFSKAVQVEIEHLFDDRRFLEQQVAALELQIKRMRSRVDDGLASALDAEKLQRQGEPITRIIERIARDYPYELEGQKPMAEVLKEIEPSHQYWEVVQGNRYRAEILWRSQLQNLESNLSILKALASRNGSLLVRSSGP